MSGIVPANFPDLKTLGTLGQRATGVFWWNPGAIQLQHHLDDWAAEKRA